MQVPAGELGQGGIENVACNDAQQNAQPAERGIAGFVLNATDPKRTGPTGYPTNQLSLSYLNG